MTKNYSGTPHRHGALSVEQSGTGEQGPVRRDWGRPERESRTPVNMRNQPHRDNGEGVAPPLPYPISSQPFGWWQWFKWGIPIAGTALIAFLLATSFIRASTDERLAQEVTANHVRSLMATHLTDVTSSDQRTVKPWFDGKIDFSPPVKDLAAQGFPLVGGRLDYLQNRPVAALIYQRHKHLINLFVWPATRNSSRTKKLVVRQGYNLIHWNESGMTFWAVSDLNPVELREFVELIK